MRHHERDAHAAVLQGVKSAHEAAAVYANHGELWCIGEQPASDELVALVDRTIDDSTPELLAAACARRSTPSSERRRWRHEHGQAQVRAPLRASASSCGRTRTTFGTFTLRARSSGA
jgi:hypothetical protein